MPTSTRYIRYEITSAGGSALVDLTDDMSCYVVHGTATLVANFGFAAASVPTVPTIIRVYYNANITLNGNDIEFFNYKLSQEQAKSPCIVEAIYDVHAAAWIVNILENALAGPAEYEGVRTTSVPMGGGVMNLAPGKDKMWQELVGSGSLTGSYSVTASGDQPDGLMYFIKYNATITTGAFNITIFGHTLSSDEALVGDTLVIACYDKANLTWRVQHVLSAGYNFSTDMVCVPVSFESTEQCHNRIYVPYNFRIVQVRSIVTKALAGTNNGTITVAIAGGSSAGVISIPASSALDYEDSLLPVSNDTGSAGDYIDFTTLKTTAGGKALLTIHLQRLA